MLQRVLVFGLTTALLAGSTSRAGTAEADEPVASAPLNLQAAYALAVDRSEDLALGAEEWRAAEARYRQATAQRWPQVAAEGSGEWRDVGGESRASAIYRAGLNLSVPIFTGLRTTRLLESRAAERAAAGLDLSRERQTLYLDVADVFFEVLNAESQLEALAGEMAALASRAAELERREALGRSRKAEVLAARADLAEARVSAAEQRGARAAARTLLEFLVGPVARDTALADETPLPDVPDVERFLALAGERPDVAAAAARVTAAQAEAGAAEAARRPTLEAGGNLYAYSDPGRAGDWDVALRAELPLFDHGLRRAAVAERRADVRISELSLARLRRSADQDVRAACAELESALDQWAALREAERVTAEGAAMQQADYAQGRATNLDVLTAYARLHALRRRTVAAELQARATLIRLHVAAGVAPP